MTETDARKFRISKRLVLINSASSVLTRILNVTVLLWAYQYLIKRIPAEEFAVYPVVSSLMVVGPLFFLAFSGGISRYIVEAHVKGEPDGVSSVISSILPFIAFASGVFLCVGTVFAFHMDALLNIPQAMENEARLMLILLVAGFATRMLFVPFEAGFHVRQRFVELNLLKVGQDILKILILLALLLTLGPRVLWLVVASVIADIAFILAMVVRARQLLPTLRFKLSLFDRSRSRTLMSFGVWSMIGHLSVLMQVHAAVIILNLFSTAVNVTAFYIGSTLHNQINRTVQLGLSPLQPVMTAMHSTDDHRRLANTAMRGGRYACWIVMAIAAPLAVYSREFIELYVGLEYDAAAWVIIFLVILQAVSRPTALMAMTAIAKAEVRPYYLANLATMFAAVAAMLSVALAGAGASGVAAALMFVIIAGYVFFFWPFFLRMIDASPVDFIRQVVLPGMLPTLAGGVVWLFLKFSVTVDGWVALILCVLSGGVVYTVVLFVACLMPADRVDFQAIVRRIKNALWSLRGKSSC